MTRMRHRGGPFDPRCLQRAELRSDDSIPAAGIRADTGIAWISVSTPKASHGSGRTACRHRAMPDFPELEPPLRTIT
jgi:hypothetical protein